MSGENTLTDQLNMVAIEEIRGLIRLFTRGRRTSEGFYLVVFRKESYLGTIVSDDVITENDMKRRCERLGVRDGDTIFRVNMGPQPLTIRDRVGVRDGYTCSYEMHLELAVRDPQAFAVRYRQQSDPVNMARVAIEGYLQQYAVRKVHDELREDMLRDYAERALDDGSNRAFGLQVTRAHKCVIFADPQRAQELAIQQKRRLQEAEIQANAKVREVEVRSNSEVESIQREIDRRHEQDQSAFERAEEQKRKEHEIQLDGYLQAQRNKVREEVTRIEEERERDHQRLLEGRQGRFERAEALEEKEHEIQLKAIEEAAIRRSALLNRAGDAVIEQIGERLEQQRYDQKNFDDVLGEHLNTRDIFGTASPSAARTPWREPRQVPPPDVKPAQEQPVQPADVPSPAERQTTDLSGEQASATLPGILRQQHSTIAIPDLGLTLLQIELSPAQREIAAVASSTAFVISSLSQPSLAVAAHLATGNILVEMNGHELRSSQALVQILQTYRPGFPVTLCILRGEDLKQVDLQS